MNNEKMNLEEISNMMATLVDEVKGLKEVVANLSGVKAGVGDAKPKERKLLRTPDLCFMLGKAPVTIYRMVRKGEIKAYKNGKELFFFEDEVEHMIKAGKIL